MPVIAQWSWGICLGMVYGILFLTSHPLHATEKPLSLKEVIGIALKENLDIRSAENDCEKSLLTSKIAAIDLWIPTAELQLIEGQKWAQQWKTPGSYCYVDPVLTLSGSLVFLEKPFKAHNYQQDKLLAKLKKRKSINEILESVVDCYYSLAMAQKKLALTATFVEVAKAQVKLAETKLNIGHSTKIERLETELTLEEATLKLLNQQVALKEACQKLNLQLGRDSNEVIVVQSSITPQPIWNITDIENSTDQLTAIEEKKVAKAKNELAITKASIFSYITLKGSFISKQTKIFDQEKQSYGHPKPASMSFNLGISLDLGKLLFLPARLKQGRLALNRAQFKLIQRKLNATQELENAKSTYKHALAAYKIETKMLNISKQKLLQIKEAYRLNRNTLLDLKKEEKKVHEKEMTLIEKGYEVKKAEFALYKLTGMLDDPSWL